jgi:hypothetical protein
MKFSKNHDFIALITLILVVFSAYVMKHTIIKNTDNFKTSDTLSVEYNDIDIQTLPFLD